MISRKHNTALSITVSTMLSASILATAPHGPIAAAAGPQAMPAILQQAYSSIHEAGWAIPAEAPAAPAKVVPVSTLVTTPASAQDHPVLTAAEMKKLDQFVQKYGADFSLGAAATSLMGLTKPGEDLPVRQMAANDDNDTVHTHYFNRSKADPGVIIFLYKDASQPIFYGYLTDLQFHYIDAYSSTGVPQKLNADQGKAGLAAEIRWWAKTIDETPLPTKVSDTAQN